MPLPAVNRPLLAAFSTYSSWMLRRNFHRVAMGGLSVRNLLEGKPFVCFCNHPSWWDPLAGLLLCRRFFSERASYAPIDAAALVRYDFFRQLGFFGVRQDHLAGARTLLSIGQEVLSRDDGALWITPQGRMQDVRVRPVSLQPGLAHLCHKCPDAWALPMAFEYPFQLEKKPELLIWLGEPVRCSELGSSPREINFALSERLSRTMDHLAKLAISQRFETFDVVLDGGGGTDFFYDLWLRAKAAVGGGRYSKDHASVVSSDKS